MEEACALAGDRGMEEARHRGTEVMVCMDS